MMIVSLKEVMSKAVRMYVKEPRGKWVLEWPGQVVIAASTVHWTTDVSEAIEQHTLKVCMNEYVSRYECWVEHSCSLVINIQYQKVYLHYTYTIPYSHGHSSLIL